MMARSLILPLVLLNLAACVLSKHGADRGIAYLGSFTFYRVVDGTRDVLVRFDQKHHWHTGFDEAFEELAAQVRDTCRGAPLAHPPRADDATYTHGPVHATITRLCCRLHTATMSTPRKWTAMTSLLAICPSARCSTRWTTSSSRWVL